MIGVGPGNSQKLYAKRDYFRDNLSSISAKSWYETFRKKINILSVYGGKKCSFFGEFGVLCFFETPILRFALLPYYRRFLMIDNIQYSLTQYIPACFHLLLQCFYHFLSTRVL